MKFAVPLAISLAALLSLPATCRALETTSIIEVEQNAPEVRQAGIRRALPAEPDLGTPEGEGAWISDRQAAALVPGRAVPAPRFNNNAFYGQDGGETQPYAEGQDNSHQGQGSGDGGGEADGQGCDDGECSCGLFGKGGLGLLGCELPCCDLWSEVQSHQCGWIKSDTLYYQVKGNPLPPLVTTSPLGTPQAQAGVLGQPNTSLVFGERRVDDRFRLGGRIDAGFWLIDGQFLGIEGHYLALEQNTSDFDFISRFVNGAPAGNSIILARPFFNVSTGLPDAALVAFPNFVLGNQTGDISGSVNVHTTNNVQSAGALFRKLLMIDFEKCWRLDLLAGYRFFREDDSVTINESFTFVPTTAGPLGTTQFDGFDSFKAINQFHGAELGLSGKWRSGRWTLESLLKTAVGDNHESIRINGALTTTVAPGTAGAVSVTRPGDLLTQPSNIGSFHRDRLAILPETALTLSYDVTCNFKAHVGYSFMYLDHVVRSGNQIDLAVNPTQIGGTLVGEARPAVPFFESTLWLQGANAGVEYRW